MTVGYNKLTSLLHCQIQYNLLIDLCFTYLSWWSIMTYRFTLHPSINTYFIKTNRSISIPAGNSHIIYRHELEIESPDVSSFYKVPLLLVFTLRGYICFSICRQLSYLLGVSGITEV